MREVKICVRGFPEPGAAAWQQIHLEAQVVERQGQRANVVRPCLYGFRPDMSVAQGGTGAQAFAHRLKGRGVQSTQPEKAGSCLIEQGREPRLAVARFNSPCCRPRENHDLAPKGRVCFGPEDIDLDHFRGVQDVVQLTFSRIVEAKRRVVHQCHVAGRS